MKLQNLFVLFFLTFAFSWAQGQQASLAALNLTEKEKVWLQQNPRIRVHNELNWAPINFNKNGIATGFSIEYMNLIASKVGLEVEYVSGEWNDLYNQAVNKKLDVMLNITQNKEREPFFLFTAPYLKNKAGIFAPESIAITNTQALNAKKVAIVDGFYYEPILRENYPLVQLVRTKNVQEALSLVCDKKVDATIGSFVVVNYLLEDMMCHDVEYKAEFKTDIQTGLRLGVRKDYPQLHSILQKAMAHVGTNEIRPIRQKWIPKNQEKTLLQLSALERRWIEQNPVVKVGGELDWAPFDFVDDNGEYNGLAKEYLDIVSKMTGLVFDVETSRSWQELLEALSSGELDLLPAIYYTPERAKAFRFSNPYLAINDYYITKEEYPKIESIKALYGKKVAAMRGYAVTAWLSEKHPAIKLLEYDTLLEALQSVASGESEAFLNDNPSATYVMEKNFILTLKMNNLVKERPPVGLHMAIKPELSPLVSIINKALKGMSQEQKREVANRWMQKVKTDEVSLNFSTDELAWLATKPTLKFAVDPKWLPLEGINRENMQYEGMLAEYLSKIQERTGINFELVPTSDWRESVAFAKAKKVDMLAALSKTEERKEFLNFTDPTMSLTDGVIMKSSAPFLASLDELKGLRVGISEGTSVHKLFKREHPELDLVFIKGTVGGLQYLDDGKVDAYVGNLEVTSHVIFTQNFLNLKVAHKLEERRELHMGLRKEVPEVALSVINKAIASISQEERNLIRKRWVGLKVSNSVDYMFLVKIAIAIIGLFILFAYYNQKLKKMVHEKTKDLQEQKTALESLIAQFDKNVIFSKTDLDGNITHVSEAFCRLSGYSYEELIDKPHNVVRHPDMPASFFESLWQKLQNRQTLTVELKNRKKDGSYYWLKTKFEPDFDKHGKHIGYVAIRSDITDKKAVEELSASLEQKVIMRTKELDNEKNYVNSIMNSQENIVISSNGKRIQTANKAFYSFFKVENLEAFFKQYGNCISDAFDVSDTGEFIQKIHHGKVWTDYIYNAPECIHKTKITLDEQEHIFSISVEKLQHNDENLEVIVFSDITELEVIRQEVEQIHKNTKESIEYASLIQHSIIPTNDIFRDYFSDFFAIWHPKDIVGGDIYLFESLREDECLVMAIDCTGHGVPGAFVTMLVKAIERQVITKLVNDPSLEVSPAWILSYFNQNMKKILRQENDESISNAGFDGGILYYNKKEGFIKFAGSHTPLFYVDEGRLCTIKGDRHSIGYKKSDANYVFKEHTLRVKEGMQFYLSTDGYFDQNGGKKGFPFGKKRFCQLLEEYHEESFADQQEVLLDALALYQEHEERNDDITVIGVKL